MLHSDSDQEDEDDSRVMSSTIGLYEFLSESELQHYYNALKSHLKVNTVAQLKFVEEEDLASIGMTKPESRRLKKFFHKYYPQTYFGKFMKILQQKTGAENRRASMIYPDVTQDKHTVKVPSKHIIPVEAISVCKELGTGEFGVVQQGVWTNEDGERIQVAIKCLSKDRMQNNPMDFLKEAAIMHTIDHEHIVRLYGVVLTTNMLMLVTELAPLRSLLECIKEPTLRSNFPVLTLCDFAIQICNGMQYLESRRLVHRDLAARNILVFSKNKVKISDFGLSRALGVGKDYYQTNFNVNLKLPIAWCAPECINYLRFTSASDVWAFGVTLWEMFSYGFQPWAALTGQQILEAIDQPNNQRLEQPECCPKDYYNIMLKCWEHDTKRRPHFSDLFTMLPECRPEQVQAISDFLDSSRKDQLIYKVGNIITVLDKNPFPSLAEDAIPVESSNLWKGILNNGKTGLFSPTNTVAYLGTSIPTMKPTNFSRTESKSSVYSSKRRLRPDMISGPQGDLKHTGHVGLDGAFFGDISFLADKYQQLPKQIVAPYKPQEDGVRSDRIPLIGSPKLDLKDLANGTDGVSRLSWVSEAPSMASLMTDKGFDSHMGSTITLKSNIAIGGDVGGESSLKSMAFSNILKPEDHEYHQISDEDGDDIVDSPMLEKSLDFGPSLMDEIFKALDAKTEHDESSNLKNEFKELTSKAEKNKKKTSSVKLISPSEERELESAIAMANEIANKTMEEMDRKMDSELGQNQESPNQQKKRFTLKLGKSGSPKAERAAFTDKTLSKPDLEGSLTPEAKEAYNVLVEQGHVEVAPEPQETELSNPLRMLRSGIPVMPKVRGNKHSVGRINSQDGSNTLPLRSTLTSRITNLQSHSMENMKSSNQTGRLYINQNVQSESKSLLLERTVSNSQLPSVPEKNQGQDGGGDASPNPLPLPPRDRTKPIPAPKPRQRKHPLILPGNSRPLVKPALSLPEMPSVPSYPRDRFASEGGISAFEDSEMSDSSSTVTESALTSYSSSDLQVPRKHQYNAYELGVYDTHDQFWSKMTTLDPQVQADIDSLEDLPEEDAPPPPLSNHRVSCEDLLEFAMDRPNVKRTQGRAHGPDSDEVHIMKKVLTQEVSTDTCLHALNETDWDIHKAIKYVKLQYLLNTQLGTIERCKQTLIHCNWDVQKAANYMLANPSEESETVIL